MPPATPPSPTVPGRDLQSCSPSPPAARTAPPNTSTPPHAPRRPPPAPAEPGDTEPGDRRYVFQYSSGIYQIPTSFHHSGPIPSQMARLTSEIRNPSRHHRSEEHTSELQSLR